jgi:hypothetical protein
VVVIITKCRICKEKLTKCNRRPNKNFTKAGRMCRTCYNKAQNEKYASRLKLKTVFMKGKYSQIVIQFLSRDERNSFVVARRLQRIGCLPKSDSSSRTGQHVDHLVEEYDPTTQETHRYYQLTVCDECGNILRYDKNGFKVCVNCGLCSCNFTLENEIS